MKKSELRKIIREEYKSLKEKKYIPKKNGNVADYSQYNICVDSVKNPTKAYFLGSVGEKEAINTLKKKFKFSDADIEKLKDK